MEVFKKQERNHALCYFCKICSKRFISGRALGGHMRAHAPPVSIAVDTLTQTKSQKSKRPRASDHKLMEEKEKDEEGLDSNGSNVMYALRKNPKRSWRFADRDYSFLSGHDFDSKSIDSSINCDLCGKEFSSWKGLFGHMKCHHSDTHQDSSDAHLEESRQHETQDDETEESESDVEIEIAYPRGKSSRFDKWMKGKRFKGPRHAIQRINPPEQFGSETLNEEEDVAMCLVMLASGVNTAQKPLVQVGAEESGSADLKLPNTGSQLSKCMRKKLRYKKIDGDVVLYADDGVKKARYKCITCNKVFHSHQALGGHRTSHNKIKGSFSQIEEENGSLEEEITDEELITGSDSYQELRSKERTKNSCVKTRTIEPASFSGKKSLRLHECSICHRIFDSGQALGGHKRGHWGSTGVSDTLSTIFSNKDSSIQQQMHATVELLDLNLPAPVDDDSDAVNLNNFRGNAVDFNGASYDQTHSLPSLQPWLMGSYQKKGLLLYSNHTDLSKYDEADSKVGNKIGFARGYDSEFLEGAQPWL